MKSKNPETPALHPHGIYNPKAFWRAWHRGPPLEPSQQIPAWHHSSKSTEKQNADPKVGQGFWRGAYRHVLTRWLLGMLWQPPWLGQEGCGGSRGNASLPCAHGWGTAFCTGLLPQCAKGSSLQGGTANKPERKRLSHSLYLGLSDCNGSTHAAPSTDYTPP